jgi:hypothetical protein
MRSNGIIGVVLVLSAIGGAVQAGAQVQPQSATAPPGPVPATASAVPASSFTPAPVPSRPPAATQSGVVVPPPLAPGSIQMRIGGRLTATVGAGSNTGRGGQ